MQLFVLFLAGAVQFCFPGRRRCGRKQPSFEKFSIKDQHPCTLDRVCEVVDTILQRQDILEKKVKENSKLFGAQPCTEGKIFGDLDLSNSFQITFCGLFQMCKISNCCSNPSGGSLTLD